MYNMECIFSASVTFQQSFLFHFYTSDPFISFYTAPRAVRHVFVHRTAHAERDGGSTFHHPLIYSLVSYKPPLSLFPARARQTSHTRTSPQLYNPERRECRTRMQKAHHRTRTPPKHPSIFLALTGAMHAFYPPSFLLFSLSLYLSLFTTQPQHPSAHASSTAC